MVLSKECIAIFVNWRYLIFLSQLKQQMVLNAIRLFLRSLIANMVTILINFQQNFALVKSFQNFAIKFLNQNTFLERLRVLQNFRQVGEEKRRVFTRVISRYRSNQLSKQK